MRASARTPAATVARIVCALAVAGLVGASATVAAAAKAPPLAPAQTTCPDEAAPPPAIDASEVPSPGQTAPVPVPEPDLPAGGPAMAGCGALLPVDAPPLPTDLAYASWLIQDLDTGAVLAAKDPHARQRPASLIKLLLAQVVARELNPATPVIGTQDDANQEGTRVGMGPGGQYTVGLLVNALLMASGNDAAHALAMQLGGMPAAVDKMNALARQLGAQDTRAASPSGLDAPGMSTSAYDLSIVLRADLATPLLANAVHTEQIPFPGYGTKPGFVLDNDNLLLRTYPGDLGGKNGYTDDAQQTYANAAQQNGHRIALVMMRGTNHLAGKWQNARELMDYGFALENAHTAPVGYLVAPRVVTGSAAPSANNVVHKQVPTTVHGAQVATVPPPSISTFGNVGLPLTILAGLALVLIGMMYLKRQRARKARAIAVARSASAETIRVALPTDLAARNGTLGMNGAVNGAVHGTPPPTTRQRPPAPVPGTRQMTRPPTPRTAAMPRPGGAPHPPATPRPGATPEWPTGPEWPR